MTITKKFSSKLARQAAITDFLSFMGTTLQITSSLGYTEECWNRFVRDLEEKDLGANFLTITERFEVGVVQVTIQLRVDSGEVKLDITTQCAGTPGMDSANLNNFVNTLMSVRRAVKDLETRFEALGG